MTNMNPLPPFNMTKYAEYAVTVLHHACAWPVSMQNMLLLSSTTRVLCSLGHSLAFCSVVKLTALGRAPMLQLTCSDVLQQKYWIYSHPAMHNTLFRETHSCACFGHMQTMCQTSFQTFAFCADGPSVSFFHCKWTGWMHHTIQFTNNTSQNEKYTKITSRHE